MNYINLFGEYGAMRDVIKENIEYVRLVHSFSEEEVNGIIDLMVDVVCGQGRYFYISGAKYDRDYVRDRFLSLTGDHIEYVLLCFSERKNFVRNVRAYLIASLFNAPVTMDAYYEQRVKRDWPDLR